MKLTKREEQLVEWLRDDAAQTDEQVRRWHKERGLSLTQAFEWESLIALKLGLAKAVEKGEPWK